MHEEQVHEEQPSQPVDDFRTSKLLGTASQQVDEEQVDNGQLSRPYQEDQALGSEKSSLGKAKDDIDSKPPGRSAGNILQRIRQIFADWRRPHYTSTQNDADNLDAPLSNRGSLQGLSRFPDGCYRRIPG